MKKLIIFGTEDIAQMARHYFINDSEYQIVAFTVDKEYQKSDELDGMPLIPFHEITTHFPPDSHDMFIALGYSKLNTNREKKFYEAKDLGYSLATYISSKCHYLSQFPPGENCFIFEDNTVQPFVHIKDNVILWSGNHIGHHSTIESHNFVSSHVVVSGHCVIKSNCFLGVNATIANNITIAEGTLVGAGALINKNTDPYGVYVVPRATKIKKRSDEINL